MPTGSADRRTTAAPLAADRVLYWIYAARLVVCLTIYGSALALGDPPLFGLELTLPPDPKLVAVAGLVLAGVATPIAYWYSHARKKPVAANFLYGQAVLDILLITGIVYITGGSESVLPPLFYIALASGYAVMLPLGSAVLVALFTGVAYLGSIAAAYPEQLGAPVLAQIGILTAVAVVSGVIGGRLRQTRRELRTVESELRRLRLDTADILRTIDSGVVTLGEDGRLAYMNPAAEELLSVETDAWIGRDFQPELERRAPELLRALRESLRAGRAVRSREIGLARKNDELLPLSVSASPLTHPEAATSVTMVLRDLRAARQLEELRLRTGRLEAVAELSASLAHEIRNPLASIRSAVEQLADADGADESDRALGHLIVRETDRLNRLLGEFNDFARVDVSRREPIDVAALVADAVEVVRQHPETSDRVRIETTLAGPFEDLWGDPDLLHRVLSNLILNAVQVAGADADLRIRVIADALRPGQAAPDLSLGAPVRLRVIDDGPGIEPDDLARIFDPFYTGREGGSGLGLSIAQRAVHAHGGSLFVTSSPGEGATFIVVLPRRREDRSPDDSGSGAADPAKEEAGEEPSRAPAPARASRAPGAAPTTATTDRNRGDDPDA